MVLPCYETLLIFAKPCSTTIFSQSQSYSSAHSSSRTGPAPTSRRTSLLSPETASWLEWYTLVWQQSSSPTAQLGVSVSPPPLHTPWSDPSTSFLSQSVVSFSSPHPLPSEVSQPSLSDSSVESSIHGPSSDKRR